MKRYRLSKKDLKTLSEQFSFVSLQLPEDLDYYEKDEQILYIFQGKPIMFVKEGVTYPTLHAVAYMDKGLVPIVKVDRGAIPFVVKGADIMRPGITFISDTVQKDQWLVVQDPEHGKDLAIGKALFSSQEMKAMEKGKVIQNLHWVGDRLWLFES